MAEVRGVMAAISIRNLDEWVVERIRVRAAEHGHSMEAEVRSILVDAAREPGTDYGLGDQIPTLRSLPSAENYTRLLENWRTDCTREVSR
jgi:hypothetical protein